MANDNRNKCPVCSSIVGDGAGKEPGRKVGNYVPVPEFQNPKGQAKAAKMREKNRQRGRSK